MTDLARLSDDELLATRLCDLPVSIEYPTIAKSISRLHAELDAKGLRFHPQCYLADEWMTPDGEPVIGIPFYLAHPRLRALEKKMMLEVEGGEPTWRMRLLRHETGHALNYAYLLHRRKRWRELFGPMSAEYPERYKYRPYSKRFVRHLDEWYAQYHPDEDFAETFAVWLNPSSNWRRKYRGWKALDKLEYVDQLMTEIGPKPPKKADGKMHWHIRTLRSTLKTHYRKNREFYAEYYPDFHDPWLRSVFSEQPTQGGTKAHQAVSRHKKELLDYVSKCTGEKKFIVNGLIRDLVDRCRELNLYAPEDGTTAVMSVAVYVTSLTMNYLYTGRFKKARR